jgi:hypothetical protein
VRIVNARVLEVQAALVASANPTGVETLAGILYEMRDEDRRPCAALILAIFEGDADVAEKALRRAMNDDPPWVARIFTSGEQWGGFPEMLVAHMIEVRDAQKEEPCSA